SWFLTACALFTCSAFAAQPVDAEDSAGVGKKIANFSLTDTSGQLASLGTLKDSKAVVVVFLGTECPISKGYLVPLSQMHKRYASRGVQFLGINSNHQDTLDRIATHAKENSVPFPVLKDEANKVADDFGAQRTPEAFVLDSERRIRYRGRIDDQFGIGY